MPGDTGHGTDSSQRDDSVTGDGRRRRQVLAAGGGVTAALLAGCSGVLPGGDDEPEINADAAVGNSTETATPESTSETDVTGLQYRTEGSTLTFLVTLSPSDAGADWWQVETLGGEKIARMTFDQPRTGGRFTTEKAVEIDDGTSAVVVRGHSAGTGYGGQVMLADLEEGYIALEKQGNDAKSFADYSF